MSIIKTSQSCSVVVVSFQGVQSCSLGVIGGGWFRELREDSGTFCGSFATLGHDNRCFLVILVGYPEAESFGIGGGLDWGPAHSVNVGGWILVHVPDHPLWVGLPGSVPK